MAIIGIILLLVVTVFALQNRTPITIQFLVWEYNIQLGLALISAAVVGAFLIYLSGLSRQRELRAQIRTTEARLREAERQRQAGANEPPQGTRP